MLAEVALQFGAFEFFWLALFGVTMSGSIVGDDPLKGWLMGLLGLFLAQVGQESLYAYNRFTFGWDELAGGIALIPALVGAFGLAEVLTTLADPIERKIVELKDSVLPRWREILQYWLDGAALRASSACSPACCPASARTPAPGCRMPRPRRRARRRRSSARARSTA